MKRILENVLNNPVVGWQFVAAVIALASSFGLELTAAQTAAIFTLCQAVAALVGRSLVMPMRKVRAKEAGEIEPFEGGGL